MSHSPPQFTWKNGRTTNTRTGQSWSESEFVFNKKKAQAEKRAKTRAAEGKDKFNYKETA
jgi:hypothetical protein